MPNFPFSFVKCLITGPLICSFSPSVCVFTEIKGTCVYVVVQYVPKGREVGIIQLEPTTALRCLHRGTTFTDFLPCFFFSLFNNNNKMCKNENPRLCARNGSRHTHKYKKVILDPLYNPILLIRQQLARIFYRWDMKKIFC